MKDKLIQKQQQIQKKVPTWTEIYRNITLFNWSQSPTEYAKFEYAIFEKFTSITSIQIPL